MAQKKAEASRDYGKPIITLKYVNSFLNAKVRTNYRSTPQQAFDTKHDIQ
jgi:hypothetical protein